MYSPISSNTLSLVNFLNSIHLMKNKAAKREEREKKTRNIKKKPQKCKTADVSKSNHINSDIKR